MLLWDDERMTRVDGIDIEKRERGIVLVHNFLMNFSGNDFAKNTIRIHAYIVSRISYLVYQIRYTKYHIQWTDGNFGTVALITR